MKKNNIFYVPMNSVNHNNDAADNIADQVFTAVETIPFGKISIPIYANKSTLGLIKDGEKDSNITIGYIKKYDKEKADFKVFIFDKFVNNVSNIINKAEADVTYATYKGDLTTIIKINIAVFDDVETDE